MKSEIKYKRLTIFRQQRHVTNDWIAYLFLDKKIYEVGATEQEAVEKMEQTIDSIGEGQLESISQLQLMEWCMTPRTITIKLDKPHTKRDKGQ